MDLQTDWSVNLLAVRGVPWRASRWWWCRERMSERRMDGTELERRPLYNQHACDGGRGD